MSKTDSDELDRWLTSIADRAGGLIGRPLPYWVEVALKSALREVESQWSQHADEDARRLAYTAATYGYAARSAECQTYGVGETIPELTGLLNYMAERRVGGDWFGVVCATTLSIISSAERDAGEPAVTAITTPPGLGYPIRQRLGTLMVNAIAHHHHPLGLELGARSSEALLKCWLFGNYFAACAASLPLDAAEELARTAPPLRGS